MKIDKPVAVIRTSQSKPPHIPRQMPLFYQVLENIVDAMSLLKKAVCQRLINNPNDRTFYGVEGSETSGGTKLLAGR